MKYDTIFESKFNVGETRTSEGVCATLLVFGLAGTVANVGLNDTIVEAIAFNLGRDLCDYCPKLVHACNMDIILMISLFRGWSGAGWESVC